MNETDRYPADKPNLALDALGVYAVNRGRPVDDREAQKALSCMSDIREALAQGRADRAEVERLTAELSATKKEVTDAEELARQMQEAFAQERDIRSDREVLLQQLAERLGVSDEPHQTWQERLMEAAAIRAGRYNGFIEDALRQYAAALESGELDGAGRYLPADLIEQADELAEAGEQDGDRPGWLPSWWTRHGPGRYERDDGLIVEPDDHVWWARHPRLMVQAVSISERQVPDMRIERVLGYVDRHLLPRPSKVDSLIDGLSADIDTMSDEDIVGESQPGDVETMRRVVESATASHPTDGRQYRAGEQAHGDALAAFDEYVERGHLLWNTYKRQDAIQKIRAALTTSGGPYVPEEVRRLPDRMRAFAADTAERAEMLSSQDPEHSIREAEVGAWSDAAQWVERALASAPAGPELKKERLWGICMAYEKGVCVGADGTDLPDPYPEGSNDSRAYRYGLQVGRENRENRISAAPTDGRE